jgi:hypothetical protein
MIPAIFSIPFEGYSKQVMPAPFRAFDAPNNHDNRQGYQFTTFSSQANYIGVINHWNFDATWRNVQFGWGALE